MVFGSVSELSQHCKGCEIYKSLWARGRGNFTARSKARGRQWGVTPPTLA